MHPDCYIVHYHEIALKGANRLFFENQLRRNILKVLAPFGVRRVDLLRGRIKVHLPENPRVEDISSNLAKVFGIAYFAPALICEQNINAITEKSLLISKYATFKNFRIETRRAQKHFPMDSVAVNAHVGSAVQKASNATVQLKRPEYKIVVEIFDKEALVYADRTEGAGGLPSGVSDRAVTLLSSGIDSPVAAYKMMRRGVRSIFVHFHSVPYTSPASIENTSKLVESLTFYQMKSKLYLIPFIEVQQYITSVVRPSYRVIMYRRMMLSIAEKIAKYNKAFALITGESVGQVASQTLPNMRAIAEAAEIPILRPLAGDDKQDIIALAEKIGTYDISIEPYEDCCSLFMPKSPETRAKPDVIEELKTKIDTDEWVQKALAEQEVRYFSIEKEQKKHG